MPFTMLASHTSLLSLVQDWAVFFLRTCDPLRAEHVTTATTLYSSLSKSEFAANDALQSLLLRTLETFTSANAFAFVFISENLLTLQFVTRIFIVLSCFVYLLSVFSCSSYPRHSIDSLTFTFRRISIS